MRLRKLAAAAAATAVALVSLSAGSAAAWTAVEGSGPAGGYQSMTGVGEGAWSEHSLSTFSTYLMPGGAGRWICIDPLEQVPSVISTNATQVDDPKVAWMMNTYSMTKDPYQAAALAYWVKSRYPSSGAASAAQQIAQNEPADWAAMQAYITALNDQANKWAGPYSIKVSLTGTSVGATISGASGQPFKFLTPADSPRFETTPQLRLTLSNATFNDGTTSNLVNSGTNFAWKVTDPTKPVTATANVAGLPGTTYTLYAESGHQRMVAKGTSVTAPLSDTATLAAVQEQPTISTVSSATAGIRVGQPITDAISVEGGKPSTTMVVPAVLYGPFTTKPAQRADAPSGAPVAFRSNVTINLDTRGNGRGTSTSFTPTAKGWYTWDVNWPGDDDNAAFNHDFGVDAETGLVSLYAPSMATISSAAAGRSKVGDEITDQIKITGGRPNATLSVVSTLYGPLTAKPAQAPTAPAGSPVAQTTTVQVKLDATGSATVTTAAFVAEEAGWYSYDTDFAGDASHNPFDAGFGVTEETGELTKRAPEITTISSAVAGGRVGDPITDQIMVTGGRPGATVSVESVLYGPTTDKPAQADQAPAGTPVAWQGTIQIKLDATGSGTGITPAYTPAQAGWYSFDTNFAGDASHEAYDAGYGVESETGEIVRYTPEATTKTSDVLVDGPGELTDTVIVSGGRPGAEFAGTTTLYGPFDTDPVGKKLDPKVDPVVGTSTFSGTFDAEGNATVVSTPQSITKIGYYVWAEVITPDDNHDGTEQPDAKDTETSLSLGVKIASTVSDQQVLIGHTITDDVTVSGVQATVGSTPIDYSLTGTLYGPVAAVKGSCEAVSWDGAPTQFAFTNALDPATAVDGQVTLKGLGAHKVAELGCYTYAYQLTATVGDDAVSAAHAPGIVEQTTIALKPGLSTQVSSAVVTPGAEISDEIKVWDTAGTPGTITAILYGYADLDLGQACSAITDADWRQLIADGKVTALGTQTITITGDGTVTTKPVKLGPDAKGCATWYEEAVFEGSDESKITTPHGVETETTLIITPTLTSEISALAGGGVVTTGAEVSDSITLTGLPTRVVPSSDVPLTVTASGTLAGPVAAVNGSCKDLDWSKAPVVSTYADTVVPEEGTVTGLAKTKLDKVGCYSYSAQAVVTHGETVVATVDHPLGDPTQMVLVVDGDIDEGGGTIDSGDPLKGDGGPALVAGIVVLGLAGAAAAGLVVTRRRNRSQV